MDKRNNDNERFYAENAPSDRKAQDEYIIDDGKRYTVPYQKVKYVVLKNISKEELIDAEHAARLQYRLLLLEPVLRAKVDFGSLKISLLYNPEAAKTRNRRMSLKGILDFLASEHVHADANSVEERDVDYYKEIYSYYYDPETVRERPPFGYTPEEWSKGARAKYDEKMATAEAEKLRKFHEWQLEFEKEHAELAEKK